MNALYQISWLELDDILRDAHSILLTTHINPDGDGIGSQVAFFHHLKEWEKDVRIINMSSLPFQYQYLNDGDIIEQYCSEHDDWIHQTDLAVIFDVGNPSRIKTIGDLILGKKTTICIDHHASHNTDSYTHNIVDPGAPSTGSLLWEYFLATRGKGPLPLSIADALYTAIVTDTGSFRYSNTNVHAHRMAIHMIESGTIPQRIHQLVFEQRKLSQVRLLGQILEGLKFAADGQVVWFHVTEEMLDRAGADGEDVDGYTDFVRSIKGVEIAFMLMETSDQLRINFRSKGKYSVNDVARHFGGGGHKFAAGATIKGASIIDLEPQLLEQIKLKINE